VLADSFVLRKLPERKALKIYQNVWEINLIYHLKKETKMAYLTISNAHLIIFKTDIKSLNLEGSVYKKNIYFFSKFENNSLLAFQELVNDDFPF
jgi:diaminopimelate epimerase